MKTVSSVMRCMADEDTMNEPAGERAHCGELVPFVQVVAGLNRGLKMTSVSPATYDARLAAQVAAAGGLDVLVNHGWAVRVLQVEGRRILASPVPPVNW